MKNMKKGIVLEKKKRTESYLLMKLTAKQHKIECC